MTNAEPDSSHRAGLSQAQQALLDRWMARGAQRHATADAPLRRRDRAAAAPLSFGQERLWFLDQLVPGSAAYSLPRALRITGPLRLTALRDAIAEIVRRHEILRTVFPAVDGVPEQRVLPAAPLELDVEDGTHLSESEQGAWVEARCREEAARPFVLALGPLLRVHVLRLAADRHVLLVNMHHIVSDGWSVGIFTRELIAAYAALAGGRPPELPELPLQYADFAAWQRQLLTGDALEARLAYWRTRLADTPPLQLPTSLRRPAVQTFRGDYLPYALSPELSAALRRVSATEQVSMFVVMLTALDALLARYTGERTIVVGTPMANRRRVELEPLIGFFANTTVIRADVDAQVSFRDLLRRVHGAVLEADAHQDVPFERLVQVLQPTRDTSRNPLFQVMFIHDNISRVAAAAGLTLEFIPIHSGTTKCDLSVSFAERPAGIAGAFEFSVDVLDRAAVSRLARHYQTLLEAVSANPTVKIADLPMLTPDERRQIVVDWNRTETDYGPEGRQPLHGLVEAQAARVPAAVAVEWAGVDGRGDARTLTYGELNGRANQLAHFLAEHGVGPDVVVGVHTENSPETSIALLGILKAGGAYLPLDPAYPPDRVEFMTADAQPPIVLTQQRLASRLSGGRAKIVCLDSDAEGIASRSSRNPAVAVLPEHAAYVIYTSGSTGRPKGVVNTHAGIVNRLLWMQQAYRLDACDRVLQKTPLSFDVSVWECFWALLAGSRVVLAPSGVQKDVRELTRLVTTSGITVMHFVPSMLHAFLDNAGAERCRSLRRVICSGEELTAALQQRFFATLDAELDNLYGPTEAAIDVTSWCCSSLDGRGGVPIGRPIANMRVHLLDAYGQPVPVGVPGELFIGGVGLARGYLARPALTAERFVPDHLGGNAGARLYRTGDLARYAPDGSIEYLGRLDHQVKIRGCRVELGEVESALRDCPGVRDAVVVDREVRPSAGRRQLVAYVMAAAGVGDPGAPVPVEPIEQWQQVFDRTFADRTAIPSPQLNLAGWNSSYTKSPLAVDAMVEQVERTAERILGLGVRSVLEIGCGTGLLLFRVAPRCDKYIGTDISPEGLAYIQEQLEHNPLKADVALLRCRADELDRIAVAGIDTVVLNSVVQYFPDLDYLSRVLNGLIERVGPRAIFVGDVRSLPLLAAFHASVEITHAADGWSADQVRRRAQMRAARENELVIDPRFFVELCETLASIADVRVELKRGRHRNELTCFRYDVTLLLGKPHPMAGDWRRFVWGADVEDIAGIRGLLESLHGSAFEVAAVPDARVAPAVQLLHCLANATEGQKASELRRQLADLAPAAVDPEDVWDLCEASPYQVAIAPSAVRAGLVDLRFWRRDLPRPRWPASAPSDSSARQRKLTMATNPLGRERNERLRVALRQQLKDRLPDYMLPSLFVFVDEWPVGPSGKLDRRSLPDPEVSEEPDDQIVEPRTSTERVLADIWCRVLSLDRVSVTRNFFELGGDSIHSIQLVVRAADSGLQLSPQDVFRHPTIAELAKVADDARSRTAPPAVEDAFVPRADARAGTVFARAVDAESDWLRRHDIHDAEDWYALAPMQEHLLYRYRHAYEPGLYVTHHAHTIRSSSVNADALEQAWQLTIDHQPALRTSFHWEGLLEPLQVVHRTARVHLERQDWRGFDAVEQRHRLAAYVAGIRARGFDLHRAPHTRLALFRCSDDTYYYVYAFNLMLQDGWSYLQIMRQVLTAYAALVQGKSITWPPALPFREYVEWTRRQDQAAAEAYWRKTLEGAAVPQCWPVSTPRADEEQPFYPVQSRKLSREATAALAALARTHHLTLYTIVQAAWAIVLHSVTGADDVVFGCVFSGRRVELASVDSRVGLFFNILPVRVRVTPGAPMLPWLEELQEQTLEARRFEYTPLERLHSWFGVARQDLLFATYLVLEIFPHDPELAQQAARLWSSISASGHAQTEHMMRVELITGPELACNILYHRRDFSHATVAAVLDALMQTLEAMATGLDRSIAAMHGAASPSA